MSHPSTHIDLFKHVIVISFMGGFQNGILIFNRELWCNNGIRDYLRLYEKRARILTTIVYLDIVKVINYDLDIRSIFRYLISVHIVCFRCNIDLKKSHKQFLEPESSKLKENILNCIAKTRTGTKERRHTRFLKKTT